MISLSMLFAIEDSFRIDTNAVADPSIICTDTTATSATTASHVDAIQVGATSMLSSGMAMLGKINLQVLLVITL